MNLLYISDSDFQMFTFFAVILGVTNLIIFWVMAANVSRIKKNTMPNDNLRAQFTQRVQLNDIDGAYEILLLIFYNWMYTYNGGWADAYSGAVNKFNSLFEKIGREVPPQPQQYRM